MTITLEAARGQLTEATEALSTVKAEVASVTADHLTAATEVTRITELIARGDRQAMTDITDARALVNGLKVRLNDLGAALAGARHHHAQAVAYEQRARADHHDVEGLLTVEQINTMWQELAAKIDKLHHPILDKLAGHKAALQELGALITQSNSVLGAIGGYSVSREGGLTYVSPSALVEAVTINGQLIHATYPSQDSERAVKKSGDRHAAATIAAAQAQVNAEREAQRVEYARLEASTAYPSYATRPDSPVNGAQTAMR